MDAILIKADANRSKVTTPGAPKASQGRDASSSVGRDSLTALVENNQNPSDAGPTVAPHVVSLSDPQSRYTAAPGGPAFFDYSTNYLIDLDAGIFMDVEATQLHRTQEVESTKTMV